MTPAVAAFARADSWRLVKIFASAPLSNNSCTARGSRLAAAAMRAVPPAPFLASTLAFFAMSTSHRPNIASRAGGHQGSLPVGSWDIGIRSLIQ